MNRTLKRTYRKVTRRNDIAKNAWIAVGGLVALGVVFMTIRELPSIAREIKLMRM